MPTRYWEARRWNLKGLFRSEFRIGALRSNYPARSFMPFRWVIAQGLIVRLLRMEKPPLTGSGRPQRSRLPSRAGAARIIWFAYRAQMSAVAPVSSLRAAHLEASRVEHHRPLDAMSVTLTPSQLALLATSISRHGDASARSEISESTSRVGRSTLKGHDGRRKRS